MSTDISEAGLESLIVAQMVAGGWVEGDPADYDREFALDLAKLGDFLEATQPEVAEAVSIREDGPTRRKFLARLQGEITKRGIVDVLRNGISFQAHSGIELFYGAPSPGNEQAAALHAENRFVVTRQLRYSRDETKLALDLCAFVNGLPVATFELKNSLTKQTLDDAINQYKRDRDPREPIFQKGRCLAHFAVDDAKVAFCTELAGKRSHFLPFDRGHNDGAGNPPNPDGIKTDYLWREVLAPASLTEIVADFAALLTSKDPATGRTRSTQIFPRYHQLDVVRRLLADAGEHGVGRRYLIQHSAGSGKSNSIAWLAHGLVELEHDSSRAFDSIIVITDRRVLDRQIEATIKAFAQVGSIVGHADRSGDLKRFIEGGKKIIVSTVQKFPVIYEDVRAHEGSRFAIIIDEAHSSQGGETAKKMSQTLASEAGGEEGEGGAPDESFEDRINRVIESRKLLPNASYFAFTATPKNKTLELFGEPFAGPEGVTRHRAFHTYTMKQAIEEGFIIDVLAHYTPIDSYYRVVKAIEGEDPVFDVRKANAKLRRYVEGNEHATRIKAEIMVDHFHDHVLHKINRRARAMVVTASIERCLDYFHAIRGYLDERDSGIRALVAFSGEPEYRGVTVSEASLNGFPSREIEQRFREDPYRILVCADKFQTGYDEPLLHTMYVDKKLAGVQAVQTLSRLNRARLDKHDAFVLDFANNAETIEAAFADYYRTTILSEETDPDKLHDLRADLIAAGVFTEVEVEEVSRLFLDGRSREELDPRLDACVATYVEELDQDEQVAFKGNAKSFVRLYGFLGQILPWANPAWEQLSIFLSLLTPKLPAPEEDDLARGILETVDVDSYRAEKREERRIALPGEDALIGAIPAGGVGGRPEPELEPLSVIVRAFNELFGDFEFEDRDRIIKRVTEEVPARVGASQAVRNAIATGDRENARIETNAVLEEVMQSLIADEIELYKAYADHDGFKQWMRDRVFERVLSQAAGQSG